VGLGTELLTQRRRSDVPLSNYQNGDVVINAGPGAAFREPGAAQVCLPSNKQLTELAERLKIEPLRDRVML